MPPNGQKTDDDTFTMSCLFDFFWGGGLDCKAMPVYTDETCCYFLSKDQCQDWVTTKQGSNSFLSHQIDLTENLLPSMIL
jgi:hypothetical protein